ncbi:enoyl-CoA hydratase/isomerase family protein [Aromatoleum bremense]|uniref:Enoyl-CoA hydratase n=1 Tax=Aromatoleum bremense TaxID=76115 RepID=A0ABX1NY96_9RHOO|nr:enoyl-CoA hydratase/isomerase family protein [Aromatoleum bremense]NMG17025.1 enoyl-CoA hydratase [Aromatoleum bremense]QTQ34172.1 Enoyl-CoA hydratase/isomerase [Aromatoleum bremense]
MSATLTYRANAAVITLNRPEALNALNGDMIQRIGALIDEVRQSEAKFLIVVGAGSKAFCAGANVKEILGKNSADQKAFAQLGQLTFAKLDELPIPSIAVVSGVAFGGGFELAMACTFRVATPKARFALPEIKLGLIPGYGGTQRLPRLVGASRALEIIATGRILDAAEAERIGLVSKIDEGDDPIAIGLSFATVLGSPPPASLLMARQAVARALDLPLTQGFEAEAALFAASTQTGDAGEGVRAFLEKRKPEFAGT